MSALSGGVAVALGLVAEEVLVTSRGGPQFIGGAIGTLVKALDRFADPSVPLIPDLRNKSAAPANTGPAGPAGPTGPPGSLEPLGPGGIPNTNASGGLGAAWIGH